MSTLEEKILALLAAPETKLLRPDAMAKRLKLKKKQLGEFRATLERLAGTGRIRQGKKGRARTRHDPGLIAGTVKRVTNGSGFFTPSEPPPPRADGEPRRIQAVFIEPMDMRDAHSGDEVLVRLVDRRRRDGQRCGRVEEVISRATRVFVGTYLEREGRGYVQVDGATFHEPVLVGDPGAKGARTDDKVVIEMLRFPTQGRAGEAVLTKVLGVRGAPGVDTLSIINEFGLRDEFPEEVLAEAHDRATEFDETDRSSRLDLTGDLIITIDPVDARDFDDAVSLTKNPDGSWRLGVHIADVSHFVTRNDAIDVEARQRGTSVYLPDRVLPMLPEIISNGLASLQEAKVRYTQSAYIDYSAEGVPIHTEFARSAIKTAWRFAYEDVLALLEGRQVARNRHLPSYVRELVIRMHELAMLLRRRRMAAGALDLSLREIKLDFNDQGAVTGAHEVSNDESHQMIEEFMLAANIAVATALNDRGIAFMRRAHPEPDVLKLKALSEFAAALGYPVKKFQSRRDLQALLDRVAGTPHERAINYALLRSLRQAEYTAEELGHYALGVEQYCHFTSPIRRYPDLTVHRIIEDVLFDRRQLRGEDAAHLVTLAKQCSTAERVAQQAERELTKVKLLTFFADKIGTEMHAIITGVERFGLFCQGIEIPIEGLIHITAMPEDYYDYEESSFSLVGRRSNRRYRLGDRLLVVVARVDIDRRQLDFRVVVEKPGSGPSGVKPPLPAQKERRPRPKASERAKPLEESPQIRANRREKKKRREDRRGR